MQLCMDSADWFKSLVCEDGGGTGSSSPSAELLACPRPPALERRLRPQHDPALKCPRCDSTHTKFCYYNNYSLSQPRYFCKTCRRYWTKGGSLRNVPVGGGCRKNKRAATKKPANDPLLHQPHLVPNFHDATDLHLSFPSPQPPPHLHSFTDAPRNLNFMECKYNLMLNGPLTGSDLMVGSTEGGSHLFMDSAEAAAVGDANQGLVQHNFSEAMNPFGFSMDGGHACLMDACQRLALPFDSHDNINVPEVKPGNKILSLEWPEQGSCGEVGRDAFGYSVGGLGLWTGMINSHGPSSTAI